ncbi:MAG: DUF4271 domain-containing protein [Bacteroidales bacterium]|nr:DUF4271 domain-containing protein [Bacteroidales bacterium]
MDSVPEKIFSYSDSSGSPGIFDTLFREDTCSGDIIPSEDPVIVKTFIRHSGESSQEILPVPYDGYGKDWLTIIILVSSILIIWMNYNSRRRLKQLLGAFFSGRAFSQFMREGDIRREQIVFPLIVIYLFTVSGLIHEFLSKVDGYGTFSGFVPFLWILLSVAAGWFVKTMAIAISGVVFKEKETAQVYNSYNMVVIFVLGIITLPALIVISYTPFGFIDWVVFVLITTVLIYRIIRQFMFILSVRKFSLFHIFLYLCTLEILPLLLLIKGVMVFNN